MPDQLAHTIFARRVIEAAGKRLPVNISSASPAFRAGAFGPDPLFNDPSPYRRAEGFEMHRKPGFFSLERMRTPVKSAMPRAAEYAAGFFCHYALDRLCHPAIKAMAAQGEIRHVPLEAAYDRALYLRLKQGMPRRIALDRDGLRAASRMYARVGPGRFAMDLEAFWQLRRLMVLGGGTRLSAAPGRLNPEWEGLIPHAQPDAPTRRGIDMLDNLMEESIPVAAEQLILYFDAIFQNRPLDSWTNADFSGFQTSV